MVCLFVIPVQINCDLENYQQEVIKSFLYHHYNFEQKIHSNKENNLPQVVVSSVEARNVYIYVEYNYGEH